MEQQKGTLYAIGVGPGDPELLTLKAVRAIARCPVVAAPQTADGAMVALDIAKGAVDCAGKTILPLRFPMTRQAETQRAAYEAAADVLESGLRRGEDTALLTLGDTSLYATTTGLAALLRARGYAVCVIPGVPSFCAVAARLGESLTEKEQPLHVLPAGVSEQALCAALRLPGTKVLMKSGKQLPAVRAVLGSMGLLEKTAMVQNCGLPGERVCPNLADPAFAPDESYFSTLIVKE